MDLEQHLLRQMAFSHATFGPGKRTNGVVDHMRKELIEVEQSGGSAEEWTDLVILALDGLTRELAYGDRYRVRGSRTVRDPHHAARMAISMILSKQTKNEARDWPDWRTAPKDKAIEHVRTGTEKKRKAKELNHAN